MSEQDFLQQVRQNQGIIYKLVLLYAIDEEEKKDLYQEVLLQAWKSRSSFNNSAKFSTWLYKVSLNTILTQKRKAILIEYKDSMEPYESIAQREPLLLNDANGLRWAIRKLPETDRAIVSLHLEGYENSEIASMVGISTNNVAVKLHRSKQQLVNVLKQEK